MGAAAGGRDDLLAAAGPAAGDASLLDLDHDDAAVVHHDRRLGKAQSVGDQFELHPRLPCSCSFAVLSRPSCPFARPSPPIFTKPTSATPTCSPPTSKDTPFSRSEERRIGQEGVRRA